MDFQPAETIARAMLHEGYLLYPYRSSALKNRYRWTFGCLFPPAYSQANGTEPCAMRTECLVLGGLNTTLAVKVRFLQLQAQQDPAEREIATGCLPLLELLAGRRQFPLSHAGEQQPLEGSMELAAELVDQGLFRVSVHVQNLTPFAEAASANREEALSGALLSCHTLLGVECGGFVSLIDPPEVLRDAVAGCHNVGTWPVLVGEQGQRELLLSAPIILPDYPQVAPQSPGDLFDSTEIDEILTLRILTLTEEEKREIAADGRARAILERTDALSREQLQDLHGVLRAAASAIKPGTRVRLRPRPGGDIFDLALAGKTGVVASIDEDHEGEIHLSIAVDDDPGSDLGLEGKPGHRFFFRPEEVESLEDEAHL